MENGPGLKMYLLLKMVIFHCYVSLPKGIYIYTIIHNIHISSPSVRTSHILEAYDCYQRAPLKFLFCLKDGDSRQEDQLQIVRSNGPSTRPN